MFTRHKALRRVASLAEAARDSVLIGSEAESGSAREIDPVREQSLQSEPNGAIADLLRRADAKISVFFFWTITALCGLGGVLCSQPFFPGILVPVLGCCAAAVPYRRLSKRAQLRTLEFSADYPAVVLATAASMKAGMSIYGALERAVQLMPPTNIVRREVLELLERLRQGQRPDAAVKFFGSSIAQPELALFRTAFVLAVEHGGRFAPTLERLAKVTRDRSLLMQAARVSTTTMRMTANALVVLTPVIVLMIAVRTEDFWELLFNHPVSNMLAALGAVVIMTGYLILQKMSNFRP